jgi:hypothetical protein
MKSEAPYLILKKDYGLEEISAFYRRDRECSEDIRSILQLNQAGRRYLIEDGPSIEGVLSRVNDDIQLCVLALVGESKGCAMTPSKMSIVVGATVITGRRRVQGNKVGESLSKQAPSHPGKSPTSRRRRTRAPGMCVGIGLE